MPVTGEASITDAAGRVEFPHRKPGRFSNTMDFKILLTVFITVFLAELGDKTQLATLLFAADKAVGKWTVFIGASSALVVAAGIGVLAGGVLAEYVSEKLLHTIAGCGFIAIGVWTLVKS